jgi:hypothetical protein
MATNPQIATVSSDIVAVFNSNFQQVFERARPLKATIKEAAKVFEHPLETGATITDHRIIMPIEIEISLMLQSADYRDVYQNIRQLFLNADLLVVQTKSGVYDNQLISAMPHEEDPAQYDAITMALTLKQAQFVTPQFSGLPPRAVRNPANASTAKRGEQQPTQSTNSDARNSSILFGVFN